MPSSKPMPRYISRQKSATAAAETFLKMLDQRMPYVIRQLKHRLVLPTGGNLFDVER
jgi:hypothetical protein